MSFRIITEQPHPSYAPAVPFAMEETALARACQMMERGVSVARIVDHKGLTVRDAGEVRSWCAANAVAREQC